MAAMHGRALRFVLLISLVLAGAALSERAGTQSSSTSPWVAGPSLPSPRVFHSAASLGSQIFVVGGQYEFVVCNSPPCTGPPPTGETDVLDTSVSGGSWQRVADMPLPLAGVVAGGIDGKLYVTGGGTPYLQIYDPGSNAWTMAGPQMNFYRDGPAAAVLDGQLYVVGGRGGPTLANYPPPPSVLLGSVDVYDPNSGTWAPDGTYAPMPTPRFRFALAELGGKLYAVGGIASIDAAGNFGPPVATVEAYDPATNTWSRKSDLLTPHFLLGAAVLNGRLYVMSGQAGSDTQIYDPTKNTWTMGAPVPPANSENYAVVGASGAIYAIGGDVGGQPPVATSAVQILHADFQLVDPVPQLIDTNSNDAASPITADLTKLALQGTSVVGTATDGVAEVVIRVPAKAGSAPITLSLTGGTGDPDKDGSLEKFSFDQPVPGDTSSSISVSVQPNTPLGSMAFAIYHAPKDYTWNPSDRTTLRFIVLQRSDGGTIPIGLLRPPVFFIHGLWSGPSTWDDFITSLEHNFDYGVFADTATYTNYQAIPADTAQVIPQLTELLNFYKKAFEVAAVQADVVGHSMGGLISRYIALDSRSSKTNPNTYGRGFVHKIITIDTPYGGSKWASRLNSSSPACQSICAQAHTIVALNGATGDLAPGSNLLQTLQRINASQYNLAPAHAIANQVTATQDQTASTIAHNALGSINGIVGGLTGSSVCAGVFPEASFHDFFNDASDLIVSYQSQQTLSALLTFPATAVTIASDGTSTGTAHSHILPLPWLSIWPIPPPGALDSTTPDPYYVFQMLNTPVTSSAFWANQ